MMSPLFLQAEVGHRLVELLPVILALVPGLLAVYLLLPRPRGYRPLWGVIAGAVALLLAGGGLIHARMVPAETVLFFAFAAVAVVAAGLLISLKNPAHAALSFALVVLSTCGLFLLQGAPFLAAATIIIYAGAIIVTFLFVLMLASQEGGTDADLRSREPGLAAIAGFVLMGALLYLIRLNFDSRPLDGLLVRMDRAQQAESIEDMEKALGGEGAFVAELSRLLHRPPLANSPQRNALIDRLTDLHSDWLDWQDAGNVAAARQALAQVRELATEARKGYGVVAPSADAVRTRFSVPDAGSPENVAPLGRTLFTDYLLAIEVAGVLLLVATIGAIVITVRRGEVRI